MKELTWQEELRMAKDYALDGPDEWPDDHLIRCLHYAEEKAKNQGIDISKQLKEIKKIWNDQLKANNKIP